MMRTIGIPQGGLVKVISDNPGDKAPQLAAQPVKAASDKVFAFSMGSIFKLNDFPLLKLLGTILFWSIIAGLILEVFGIETGVTYDYYH